MYRDFRISHRNKAMIKRLLNFILRSFFSRPTFFDLFIPLQS
ncbi:hypothetical protein HJ01_03324 [Flavobacterium frigoris PS1]|uniref:Uncharacterized protein n=1 Tax=Flavobacterium frigoris (strain PS1) TaxID=1086011 RepID=H7FVZ8_FLAFP|nr:hypothetical protein HJ01_03324 [Flavobacterium frigoris PS1]